MKKLINLLAAAMAVLSGWADDVYGPFGSDGNLAEDVQQLTPTVYDVALTIKGKTAVPGDCIAAYRTSDNALCGIGMVYDSDNGVIKCDLVLRSFKGATIHFKAWQCCTPATAENILDVDASCDIVAPNPGTTDTPKLTLFVPSRTFTVKFNKNGGTGTMQDQKFQEGVEQARKKNAFAKSCSMFTGWKDQKGNEYEDEETITPTSDLTLTAQWEAIVVKDLKIGTFNVECNTGWEATVSDDSWIMLYGTEGSGYGRVEYGYSENKDAKERTGTITITSKVDSSVKATFTIRQSARPSGPSPVIVNGVLVSVDMEGYSDFTIPDTVTAIDANAFACNDEVRSVRIPATVTEIRDSAFAGCANLTNVVFDGDAPTAGNDVFKDTPDGLVVTVRNDKTGWPEEGGLWPDGDANARSVVVLRNYIVSFDWNGWEEGPTIDDIVVEPGEMVKLPYPELHTSETQAWSKNREGVRPGYSFGWWNDSGDIDEEPLLAYYTPERSIVLKARWYPHSYAFKFDANGGKPAGQEVSGQLYGGSWKKEEVEEPTLANAAFDGWWTAKTGGDPVDLDGVCSTVGKLGGTMTLYAHWRKMYKAAVKDGMVSEDVENYAANITVLSGTDLYLEAADKSAANMEFSKWTVSPATANLGENFDPRNPHTPFTMPDAAVTFTANYIAKPGYVEVSAFEQNTTANADGDPQGIEWSDDGKVWTPVGDGMPYPVKTGKSVAIQFRSTDPRWTVPAKVTYQIVEGEAAEVLVPATRVAIVSADAEQEQFGASGTVSMNPKNGQVLPGKPVALTAKPGKDTVFAYWLVDGEKVGYTATFKYAPDVDSTATAVFRLKSAVEDPELDDSVVVPSANSMVGVAFEMAVPLADAAYPAKFTASGLPAGLKIDAASGVISGVPTKVGNGSVTITAAGGVNAKAKSSITLPITVKALPGWAQGTFTGYSEPLAYIEDVQGWVSAGKGSASLTVSSAGKVGGKVMCDGTNWTFAASSYSTASKTDETGSETFVVEAEMKSGKIVRPFRMTVNRIDAPDVGTGASLLNAVADGETDDGSFQICVLRNMWKDKATSVAAAEAIAPFIGVYTASIKANEGAEHGNGYLSITVDKSGNVKATGKLPDGTGVSSASQLSYSEIGAWDAELFIAPSAYKGGAFAVSFAFYDGYDDKKVIYDSSAWWESRNPQATGEYGEGFFRLVEVDGAYYDKLKKLNDYYDSLRFGTTSPKLSVSWKHTYLDDSGRKVTETATLSGEDGENAVNTLDQDGMTVTVNEKGALVVAKATKPVQDMVSKEWSYDGVNDGALTLSFAQATGIFKGSYTFWYDYLSAFDDTKDKATYSHTSKKVSFEGIMVQGQEKLSGFYLWDETGVYEDEKTGKEKTYKYKQSYPVLLLAQ